MNLLITGASGFVGSRLTNYLLGKGHNVSLVLRQSSTTTQLASCEKNIRIYRYSQKFNELTEIIKDSNPSVIVHTASLFLSSHSHENIPSLVESNILFPTQLLEAMSLCNIDRLINTGTSWQHFNNMDYSPVNLYAATKKAFEDICAYYKEAMHFKIITLKLFDTYGPDDPRDKIIQLLKKMAGTDIPIAMSPGRQQVDLVHIDDVCSAYGCALERIMTMDKPAMEEYGISSGHRLSLQELVRLYVRISGEKIDVRWGGKPYRAREVMIPWTDYQKLPGWTPVVSLEEGLRQLS